jgi:hypothetical protein
MTILRLRGNLLPGLSRRSSPEAGRSGLERTDLLGKRSLEPILRFFSDMVLRVGVRE